MMGQIKDEANRLGDITVVESDGERSSPKQSADLEAAITKGVDGIVINPMTSTRWRPQCRRP